MARTWTAAAFVAVVAVAVALPLWYPRLGAAGEGRAPLARPRGEACVEPADVMRRRHMVMLDEWRQSVVRGAASERRTYVSSRGVSFEKSLTRTCLGCHGAAAAFCDRCHERVAVKITCFDCHVSGDARTGSAAEASNVRR